MNVKSTLAALTSAAVLAGALIAPAMAQGSRQNDKNNMRNIGIGAGAAAAYEALHGRGTHALILGAGAAYAGKKYEDQRKAENKDSNRRYGSRHHSLRGRRVGYYSRSAHSTTHHVKY